MKRTIVAILALSPVLAFAQTNAPAQPRSTQISEVVVPAGLHAAASAADHSATTVNVRVSTGVTPPKVLTSARFVSASPIQLHTVGADQHVVVSLNVDETGKPSNVAVVQSANPVLDQDVVATVARYRFKPGLLDGQPTAVPVRLDVVVPAGTLY